MKPRHDQVQIGFCLLHVGDAGRVLGTLVATYLALKGVSAS